MKTKPVELKVTVTTGEGTFNEANYVVPITVPVPVVQEKPEHRGFRIWYQGIEDDGRTMLRLGNSEVPEAGSVTLFAVDVNGFMIQAGRLISISSDGYLERRVSVNEDIPIQRDCDGRIREG